MIYTLKKKRAFTLDNEARDMVLLYSGDKVKIEDANVYIWIEKAEEWWLTIDIVTQHLMNDLCTE